MPWVKKETQSNNVCKEGRPKKQWPEKDAENQEKVPRRGSLKKRGPRTCVQMEGIVPLSCPISPQGRKRKTVSLVLNASVKEEGWSGGWRGALTTGPQLRLPPWQLPIMKQYPRGAEKLMTQSTRMRGLHQSTELIFYSLCFCTHICKFPQELKKSPVVSASLFSRSTRLRSHLLGFCLGRLWAFFFFILFQGLPRKLLQPVIIWPNWRERIKPMLRDLSYQATAN